MNEYRVRILDVVYWGEYILLIDKTKHPKWHLIFVCIFYIVLYDKTNK